MVGHVLLLAALFGSSPTGTGPALPPSVHENLAEPPQDVRLRFWLLEQKNQGAPLPVSQAPSSWNLGRWYEVLTIGNLPAGTLALAGTAQRGVAGCDEFANPFMCPAVASVTIAPQFKPKNRKLAVFTGVLLNLAADAVRSTLPTIGMRW